MNPEKYIFKSKAYNFDDCEYLNSGELDVVGDKPGQTVTHEEHHHVPPATHENRMDAALSHETYHPIMKARFGGKRDKTTSQSLCNSSYELYAFCVVQTASNHHNYPERRVFRLFLFNRQSKTQRYSVTIMQN